MAKRKRLTAPDLATISGTMPPLETKSLSGAPLGKVPDQVLRRSAPIADVAAEAATMAALDEMSDTLRRARAEGRMVLALPLEAIQMDYLVRDRVAQDDEAMAALVASLNSRGQQVPIEVADLGAGNFGLISGWRRCQALAQIHRNRGDSAGTVLALIRTPAEASDAYLAMVEENEIRVGLSYFERARIVAKSAEQGVFSSPQAALKALFHAASRAKRSKIGTFLPIVTALDGALRFPGALTERGGLALGRALQDNAALGPVLRTALERARPDSPQAELACLMRAAQDQGDVPAPPPAVPPAPQDVAPGIRIKTHANGTLTLSGPRVDADLASDLRRWLADRVR